MKTFIHINQHVIKKNKLTGERNPVITCKNKSNSYHDRLDLVDSDGKIIASVVYSPDKPLKCGAVCWIETDSKYVAQKPNQVHPSS